VAVQPQHVFGFAELGEGEAFGLFVAVGGDVAALLMERYLAMDVA
jgi:hypothetical protein